MLTFEEFFVKKRIDLKRLQQAKPELYEEFKAHYPLMGEKSFDHTKKYWFNRLRKDFQLSEVEVMRIAKPETPKVARETVVSDQKASKPAGFTPRFKAKTAAPKPEVEETEAQITSKAPTGFKPRFKPGVTAIQKETPKSDEPSAESAEKTNPLGFKPRFKAGVTPPAKPVEESKDIPKEPSNLDTDVTKSETPPKPLGFKPRFRTSAKPIEKPPTDKTKNDDA